MTTNPLTHRSTTTLIAAGLLAWSAPLAATALADNAADEPILAPGGRPDRLLIRSFPARETFLVQAPDAHRSPASRVNTDHAGPDGIIPEPTPGYVITSTLVLQAADRALFEPAAAKLRTAVEPFPSLPGFWLVHAASVRAAADAAESLRNVPGVASVHVAMQRPFSLRDLPTDPSFPQQWHLLNTVNIGADANPLPAWNAGFTGQGVTVGVVELGWQISHPDLADNFNAPASQPLGSQTGHGTAVAGIVAAVADNGIGGAGIAYNANLSNLYIGSSADNAAALLFANNINDIKTNSWGPPDIGYIWPLMPEEAAALQQSVSTGRSGLGLVIVWAAGNGGTADRVDYDSFASSRYTMAIGAIDETEARAYYNESGSAMFAVAHSNGLSPSRAIFSTDAPNSYTSNFGGTSASAPLAAGAVALVLDANPSLTWRDVQHVVARSARRNLPADPSWVLNGGRRWVSYDYGFGAVDAGAAAALAASWTNVGPELVAASGPLAVAAPIPDNAPAGITRAFTVTGARRVETVEVVLNVSHTNIGDLRVELVSPAGTSSILAQTRPDPSDNFVNFVFTSFRHWGELAAGTWTLNISDRAAGTSGTWTNWRLNVYGTCAVDFDSNGAVNSGDVSAFVTRWFTDLTSGSLNTDYNSDGAVSSGDVSAFITDWFGVLASGC